MIQKIFKNKFVCVLSLASLFLSLGGFIWAYVALKGHPGAALFILHFNDIQGINQVGGLGTIIFMGVFGTIVVIMNSLIAFVFGERDVMMSRLTSVLTLVFSILLFMGFASIIAVN